MRVMPPTLSIRGAAENNLKSVDLDLPVGRLIVVSGVSGSGKSSLAFDTIYAEARRRFLSALDAPAARLARRLRRPRFRSLEGLAPPIAIDQAGVRPDSRATAATLSGAYEYFRLLFARVGQARCLACAEAVVVHRFEEVYERAAGLPEGTKLQVLAPVWVAEGEGGRPWSDRIERAGFGRIRLQGDMVSLDEIDAANLPSGSSIDVVVDRLVIKPDAMVRLKGSLEAAAELSAGRVTLAPAVAAAAFPEDLKFSVRPSCSACGAPFEPITPGLFSFNSPRGACSSCRGIGVHRGMEFERFFVDGSQTLDEALGALWTEFGHDDLRAHLERQCDHLGVDAQQPVGEWPPVEAALLWQSGRARARGSRRAGASSAARGAEHATRFPGLRSWLERRAAQAEGDELAWFEERIGDRPCAQCDGTRLSAHALSVWIEGETIASLMARPVGATLRFLEGLRFGESGRPVGEAIAGQIARRLLTIEELGLGYLSLDRPLDTLSCGELQRLRLAAALGSDMTCMLYVLDEPSVGLHARDADRLARALSRLRDDGNTVIVVEHDLAVMRHADYLVDMGPGAGVEGGHVTAQGRPDEVAASTSSTGRYLRGEPHAIAARRRPPGSQGWLELRGASGHNLKEIDAAIPLQCLVAVSGVSGSGKSSLVHGTLYRLAAARLNKAEHQPLPFRDCRGFEHLGRVLAVDQRPIGRSPRSNAASYSGLMTHVRRLYAELPEARMRGYKPAHFSFNAPQGACDQCGGSGAVLERRRLLVDSVARPCSTCSGRRFKRETLDVRFRHASIADVLEMSVVEALDLFDAIPEVARRLHLLRDLGLGYLVLGQPASSLSGGEAQRLKLTAELGRPVDSRVLYVLDEPTTGLHIRDVEYLVELLQRLVDRGHTVLVVEHDLDVIRCADFVIDMGPEAGEDGGQIVAAGTPDEIAAAPGSHTGKCLARRERRWTEKAP